jgi:hypothetical protein
MGDLSSLVSFTTGEYRQFDIISESKFGMKLFSSIIAGFLMLAVSVAIFFMALVALNGFSERQANPGLFFLLAVQLLLVLSSAVMAGPSGSKLQKIFGWRPGPATVLGVVAVTVMGTVLSLIALFLSVLIVSV